MPLDPVAKRKEPSQSRSRATVAFILEGAAQLFSELGYDRVSTNKIARRAGVSIGSLYQYFPNKEALLLWAVKWKARRNIRKITRVLDQARQEAAPPMAAIRQAVKMSVGMHARFRKVQMEAGRRLPGFREKVHAELRPLMEPVVQATERLLAGHTEFAVADPRLAAIFTVETIHERNHWYTEQGQALGISPEAFTEELCQLIEGYVRGEKS